jgi:hypothetical protein
LVGQWVLLLVGQWVLLLVGERGSLVSCPEIPAGAETAGTRRAAQAQGI